MRLSVQVDTQSLSDSLHRLASVAREAPGIIIKEETKALVKNIWQLTPPKTYAQGRAAVQGDMSKLISPLNADTLKDKQMADAVRGNVAPYIRGVIHNNIGTAHDWQYGEAITHWMPLPQPPELDVPLAGVITLG